MRKGRQGGEADDNQARVEEEIGRRPARLVGGIVGGDARTSSGRHSHHFLDRSKVRVLHCDGDPTSSSQVFALLCKCSYQVISVKTARQVIDALNAQGSDIDILLSEVDLPISKGLKMLKYIVRNKDWRHIPIVMMSAKDEVPVVVKCLRLGAVDYLVKPLRTNELLNLWTHMWRRRHMLGLSEKEILSHEFDLLVSDPSDGNTNSTLLSDDTDDQSKSLVLESGILSIQELQAKETLFDVRQDKLPQDEADVSEDLYRSGKFVSYPRKNELRVGQSSAFLTYVKSSTRHENLNRIEPPELSLKSSSSKDKHIMSCKQVDRSHGNEVSYDQDQSGFRNSVPRKVGLFSETLQISGERYPSEGQSSCASQSQHDDVQNASGVPPVYVPYYFPGTMRQNVMHSCPPLYQGGFHDVQAQGSPVVLPQYNPLSQCAQVPMLPSYAYYPVNLGVQQEQMPSHPLWTAMPNPSAVEGKSGRIERREAALMKFRQKRKDRCFDKKIRYANRKRLAERRPRVRGQFARQLNGAKVDLNGCPAGEGDFCDEDDEDEEESVPTDMGYPSSPEPGASEF